MTGIPNIGCQRVNQPEIKGQNMQFQDVIEWCFSVTAACLTASVLYARWGVTIQHEINKK
jgi:hypothetical protein